MKLIDFDGIFDKKIAEYIEKNSTKYTEDEWSDVIPKLYEKFGNTQINAIGTTPNLYYSSMSDADLAALLKEHIKSGVPVSDFLCREMEKRGACDEFLQLLSSSDEELLTYAITVNGTSEDAYGKYLDIICSEKISSDVRDAAADMIKENADPVKARLLNMIASNTAKEYALDLIARVKERDEAVYNMLLNEFLSNLDNIPKYAHLLSSYGDERYIPYLLEEIKREDISYIDFLELKYAIEKLGGEYNEERNFSSDPYYAQIHGANADFTDENMAKAFAAEKNDGKLS